MSMLKTLITQKNCEKLSVRCDFLQGMAGVNVFKFDAMKISNCCNKMLLQFRSNVLEIFQSVNHRHFALGLI